MSEQSLAGLRVFIVEDEYMLVQDLSMDLVNLGARIVGPAGTLAEAMRLAAETAIDVAVLDVNLQGKMVFPVADLLMARSVPFLFATGYDGSIVPGRFHHVMRCEKPFDLACITQVLERLPEPEA